MVAYSDIGTPVENATGTGQNGNTMSINCDVPGTSTSGRYLVATFGVSHVTGTGTEPPGWAMPAGWTKLHSEYLDTAGYWFLVCVRTDPGGLADPQVFQWTAGTEFVYANSLMAAYTGSSGTIDDSAMGTETTGTDKTAPALTSTYTNSLMIVVAWEDNFSLASCTGFTERYDSTSFGNKFYDKAITATGSTGTATVVSSAGNGVACSILLQDSSPTGGGGGTAVPVFYMHRTQMGGH